MKNVLILSAAVIHSQSGYFTRIDVQGDGLRLRIGRVSASVDPELLESDSPVAQARINERENQIEIETASIRCVINDKGDLHFYRLDDGLAILTELPQTRQFVSVGDDRYRTRICFAAKPNERLYGMGQYQHGFLDQSGCVLDLKQSNMQVSVPLLISSERYAFVWNHPGIGRATFGKNRTEWSSDRAMMIDFWIASSKSMAGLHDSYGSVYGRPPMMPEWCAGYWQSKLRYASQDELLRIAREFERRGIPLSVLVIDYFHWTRMGDWTFDPNAWPDPAGMMRELQGMKIKVAISVWPTLNADSRNYPVMRDQNLLIQSERGQGLVSYMADQPDERWQPLALYDATNPEARTFLWEQIRDNYLKYGIDIWWLDACEPEINPEHWDNIRFHAGRGDEVALRFPLDHQSGFSDGMKAAGRPDCVTLSRSAWIGSQKYGTIVWSGDISATWQSFRKSIPAGLNMAMAGIPWWTTDIGGFEGGDPMDPAYRELFVRWFQYGTFCPVMRVHGHRHRGTMFTGAANEPWSYGEEVEKIVRRFIEIRYRLREYILMQMRKCHESSLPPMRPLFYDFSDDPSCINGVNNFLLGADLLIAPVLHPGISDCKVYLPAGEDWIDAWSGDWFEGGKTTIIKTGIEIMPVFIRARSGELQFLAKVFKR